MKYREKIAEIIKKNGTYNGRSLSFDYYVVQPDDLAKALIAEGIGEVKETKFESDHYWSMWQGSLVELERAEHRAEVAEKALDKACADMGQLMDCCRWAANGGVITIEEYTPEKATPRAYKKRAEKELAEEKKND